MESKHLASYNYPGSSQKYLFHETTGILSYFLLSIPPECTILPNSRDIVGSIFVEWCNFHLLYSSFYAQKFIFSSLSTFQIPSKFTKGFAFIFLSFVFLGPHQRHMEVPRLGVESELPAYTTATATATSDLSRVCDLHGSSWQRRVLNPLSEGRNRTRIFMDASLICFHGTTMGILCFLFLIVKFNIHIKSHSVYVFLSKIFLFKFIYFLSFCLFLGRSRGIWEVPRLGV